MNGLVSIITPCYNGAGYIGRLLDSVLMQDYPNIEMFVVDDGSTDDSYIVVNSYISKFKSKGFSLQCIRQNNSGQAAALQKALLQVSGEFLIWPDSDDFYSSINSISEFVKRFSVLPTEYGIVRCFVNYVSEKDHKFLYLRKFKDNKEKQFEEFFLGKESIAVAGLYMVRMSSFDKANPERKLYVKEHPQNWQMLLPVLYSSKISTIEKPLYTVVIRDNSHSRAKQTFERSLKILEGYLNILVNTIDQIKMSKYEKEKYILMIKKYIYLERVNCTLFYYKKNNIYSMCHEYKAIGGTLSLGKRVKITALLIHPVLLKILMFFLNVKRIKWNCDLFSDLVYKFSKQSKNGY